MRKEQTICLKHAKDEGSTLSSRMLFNLFRAGWVSMLLLEWLRKECNHPAQGRAAPAG